MRLTLHTDYAFRVLILATRDPKEKLLIGEVAEQLSISRNHLMKVVHQLALSGFLETMRGRSGGFRLARAAEEIKLGDIVRVTEPNLRPVDCTGCLLLPACGLPSIFRRAMIAFLSVLDDHTLADAAKGKISLETILLPVARSEALPLA